MMYRERKVRYQYNMHSVRAGICFCLSLIAIVRDHTMRDESLSHVNEGVLDIVVLDT